MSPYRRGVVVGVCPVSVLFVSDCANLGFVSVVFRHGLVSQPQENVAVLALQPMFRVHVYPLLAAIRLLAYLEHHVSFVLGHDGSLVEWGHLTLVYPW